MFANISEITCWDTLYLKKVKFYWKMGFKNWNTLVHITSVLQNFSYPIPTTTPLLHFQKQGDWNSTMVISILTCVCKFYQNWIQTFCALKKPDFWMIKVTLVAFYFLIVPALIFFLLKCGYFFASLLWNCFWKFAFFFLLKVCFGANAIFVSSSYLKVVREEEKSMLKGYLRRRRAAASEERESWLNFLPSKHSFT